MFFTRDEITYMYVYVVTLSDQFRLYQTTVDGFPSLDLELIGHIDLIHCTTKLVAVILICDEIT